MIEVPFSKYSGCGNDFILVDNRNKKLILNAKSIQSLCNRSYGIGADGIILLEKGAENADFGMRIFNCNGTEAEMCGNGLRCLGLFIQDLGFSPKPYKITTKEQTLSIGYVDGLIKADMGNAKDLKTNIELDVEGNRLNCSYANTGVPHAVVFVNAINDISVQFLGSKIRHHQEFSPNGTNVNFVQKMGDHHIAIRTFERGVENETLACGTGACASAISASLKWNMKSPIDVTFFSGDNIKISFVKNGNDFNQITQIGPAIRTFYGVFDRIRYL